MENGQSVFLSRLTRPGRVRLARFARIRLLRHTLPISLLILRKTLFCSLLESIWKNSIPSASPHLQTILWKMLKYNVEMRYSPCKTNAIGDAPCRVCCMESPDEGPRIPLLEVDAITHTLPTGPAKLDEIQNYTNQDINLSHLKDVIQEGWSEYPIECPANLKEFSNFREDLSVENGLILKGHCLLIPSNLRTQVLQIIHQGHLGAEQCNLKA